VKARLIVNPRSGTDSAPDALELINRELRKRLGRLEIVMTVTEGDATDAAAQAVNDGVDHLFVGGGDGTLNEALNGVANVPGGFAAVRFGIIPLGTGNDFATALGIPDDLEQAIAQLFDATPVLVDVGRVNGRSFVNVSAGGFIAEVSDAVNPQLKTIAGKFAYLLGGAQVVLNYEPVRATIRLDGRSEERTLHTFAVCNSRLVGGGRLIAPHAQMDDGLFDVCMIEAMPTVDFLALLRRVSNGEHLQDPRVTYVQTHTVDIACERAIKINVDGQVLEADRCAYDLVPRAATFLGYREEQRFDSSNRGHYSRNYC
jgi:diacylglycerol kinase (ATP)